MAVTWRLPLVLLMTASLAGASGCGRARRLLGGRSDDGTEARPVDAAALAGSYTIAEGESPRGGRYGGTARIESSGAVHHVFWSVDGGESHEGVGVVLGDTLAVGWGSSGAHGVVAYRIHGGVLEGTWATASSRGETGHEKIEGPPGLDGRYEILEGRNPDGSSYGGTVDIERKGDVLSLRWEVGGSTHHGVGLRHGPLLVAAWGPKDALGGAVAYRVRERSLEGPWAANGGTHHGKETLRRR